MPPEPLNMLLTFSRGRLSLGSDSVRVQSLLNWVWLLYRPLVSAYRWLDFVGKDEFCTIFALESVMLKIDWFGYLVADLSRSLPVSVLQISFMGELNPVFTAFLRVFIYSELKSKSTSICNYAYWLKAAWLSLSAAYFLRSYDWVALILLAVWKRASRLKPAQINLTRECWDLPASVRVQAFVFKAFIICFYSWFATQPGSYFIWSPHIM